MYFGLYSTPNSSWMRRAARSPVHTSFSYPWALAPSRSMALNFSFSSSLSRGSRPAAGAVPDPAGAGVRSGRLPSAEPGRIDHQRAETDDGAGGAGARPARPPHRTHFPGGRPQWVPGGLPPRVSTQPPDPNV